MQVSQVGADGMRGVPVRIDSATVDNSASGGDARRGSDEAEVRFRIDVPEPGLPHFHIHREEQPSQHRPLVGGVHVGERG